MSGWLQRRLSAWVGRDRQREIEWLYAELVQRKAIPKCSASSICSPTQNNVRRKIEVLTARLATVRKLVAFYVEQHKKHLPHAAFHGQTPDEMYFGTGADIPKQLAAAKVAARQARLAANRTVRCQSCGAPVAISN